MVDKQSQSYKTSALQARAKQLWKRPGLNWIYSVIFPFGSKHVPYQTSSGRETEIFEFRFRIRTLFEAAGSWRTWEMGTRSFTSPSGYHLDFYHDIR